MRQNFCEGGVLQQLWLGLYPNCDFLFSKLNSAFKCTRARSHSCTITCCLQMQLLWDLIGSVSVCLGREGCSGRDRASHSLCSAGTAGSHCAHGPVHSGHCQARSRCHISLCLLIKLLFLARTDGKWVALEDEQEAE